jgi:hypothetical protein
MVREARLDQVESRANVEPKGRYRHGKPQLRVDEARRWLATSTRRFGM